MNDEYIVAPVAKKELNPFSKAWIHGTLIQDWPACVSVLSVVRDAAARLPDGFGTRLDICELFKHSQFVDRIVDDVEISKAVSGALDRL